ncbi:MAG: nitrophenyl compound nitroreductase subunit ArsF family protein [Bacteroidota bacterium]|nr:nitrophenyl compound nitroreductase subunit ArsF family protein [Bacteroidota bacterium]
MNKIFFTIVALVTLFMVACNQSKPTSSNEILKEEKISNLENINSENFKLEVFAFHGTNQCTTCKNMKANTKVTLDTYFAEELKSGKILFQIVDVDDSKNEKIAEKFEATGTALMINQIENGKEKIVDLSDFAFEKANSKDQFIKELKQQIEDLLK